MMNRTADAFLFFRAWLSAPLRVASVTPSGRALSSLMTAEISAQTGTVIELGPGTGVFTEALLQRGVAEENLVLVEYGAEFANQLSNRFPAARTVQMDAARLRKLPIHAKAPVGAVVSGLPLLSMPSRKVLAIVEGAFSLLRHNGAFYQFTYGPRCPIARPLLDRLGLKATYVGWTFANIPPAAVYRITRRRLRQGVQSEASRSVTLW
ncbi:MULTISPECIES: methyltransferase domain-containing protein [Rhizobium]|uniref:Phospholipid methyltransferase n=1 Tax=Rhizobium tropici TaxID=398 RepID=A0A329YEZ2_RHITR|nr:MULTISPECIES: methyltransferase domain-containing protein [Rhizobium]MBB3290470.1 phospholipid N-methyltransferase [Rhizobium sp. BK252]MBB3405212.1 phospholipid N-methyltransferase [Rhizobium sp. BK289]MBB3417797.1 phospholipid N-methyltransferase [Rhizobium sp. BK284]MBB3485676.1 phospholipid N-methyltransferase [Rhizobium sp. BK347]MDK4717938.1 methyltransferase domain-containing protein [Rhizobium sp. CNPSo 3968]